MEEKIIEIKNEMLKEGLDVLIFHYPEELIMAFDYYPFWGQSFGLFFQKKEPLLFIPNHEPLREKMSQGFEVTSEIGIKQVIKRLCHYQVRNGISELVIGGSLLPKNSSIPGNGAEMGGLGATWWEELIQTTSFQVQDVRELLEKLSMKKSKRAIEKIKQVHELSEIGLESFYNGLQPGNSELELSLEIEKSIKLSGMFAGMNFVSCYAQIQAGENTLMSATYNRTTLNLLQAQDLVLLELAVCMDGYWLDLTRTGVVGQPTEEQNWYYEQIENTQRKVVEKMQPGVPIKQLYQLSKRSLEDVHLEKLYPHGLGHSVGYQYHDPGLSIVSDSEQVLEIGMILTIEPGIYGRELAGGMRIEDNFLVTESGVELLSKGLRGLIGESYMKKRGRY